MTTKQFIHGFFLIVAFIGVFCIGTSRALADSLVPGAITVKNVTINPRIDNQPTIVSFDYNRGGLPGGSGYGGGYLYSMAIKIDGQWSHNFFRMNYQYGYNQGGWVIMYDLNSAPVSFNIGTLSPGQHTIQFIFFGSEATGMGTSLILVTQAPINFSIVNHSIPSTNGACSVPAFHYQCSYGSPINGKPIGFGANPIYMWTCQGVNGGTDKMCVEMGNAKVVEGACSSVGYSCASGAAGNFAYSGGIYSWSCYGSNGGSNASCVKTPSPPVVNSVNIAPRPVVIDAATQHTITSIATDTSASDSITDELVRINYQGANAGVERGYLGWSKNSEFPLFGGTYKSDPIACAGGGSAVIYGGGNGFEYLNLVSCDTYLSWINPNQRIVSFAVTFNPNFTTPLASNTLSGYAYNNNTSLNSGWSSFGTFGITIPIPSTLKMCPNSCTGGGTPYNTFVSPFPADSTVTLYACYGTGNCSLGDANINGTWTETNTPDNAISLSAGSGFSVDVTQSNLGDATEQFSLSYPSAIPVPTQVTATAAVSCAALTCNSPSITSQRTSYCPAETRTFDNSCAGTIDCSGTRNCDYNWREVAP